MTKTLTLAAAIAAATITNGFAADPLQDLGKKLSADHQEAIVWISVIAKMSMSAEGDVSPQIAAALAGQDKEEKSETTGTVIDSSGLIVAALGGLDKASVVDGQTVNTPMGEIKLKSNSQIKEVKVITADGSEIPADVVMKDDNLGLAFVKVRMDSEEAKGVTFKSINLADSAKGDLLDKCVTIARMDESLNREASASTAEITGVTTRPRTFYRVGVESLGCPVFLESGKLLGISVVRKPSGGSGRDGQIKLSPVILPAADIAKVAEEAKNAKPVKPAVTEEGDDEEETKASDKAKADSAK